jgi:hypothetical protein
MLDDISPVDFAHHVRHANGWNDLGVRCGLEKDKDGRVRDYGKLLMLHQKVNNMRLNVDHFHGQLLSSISDDDFKTIVLESDSVSRILMKCNMESGGNYAKIVKRIADLCIDTKHFKSRKIHAEYKHGTKVHAIDDETFKMLVNNNKTWENLAMACGYRKLGGTLMNQMKCRIEKLGLNTYHFGNHNVISADKIFVVDSKYASTTEIQKRLCRDFDRVYECAACKNEHFTKCDGVLMWNNKEIVLQLEHKNGISNDNRLENLEFLCPSCHSQTSTFTGRNGKKHKAYQIWIEEGKTSHAPGSIASLLN